MSQQETGFDPTVFEQYAALNRLERLILRTCCYYPPLPKRVRTPEHVNETERYIAIFEGAFGPQLWPWIAGRDVLDFGCGEGGFSLALAEKGAGHVTGLDILPAFQFAEATAESRGYAITFVGASSETLSDAQYDVVISHDSFEHFEQPELILNEMVRLTRPGGRILIKFGPPWRNPWGRHMGGTYRRDRPWIHLVLPEKAVMRVHSVYHNEPTLSEQYSQLPGGMNKMTVSRFEQIVKQQPGIAVDELKVLPLYGVGALVKMPGIADFFAGGMRLVSTRT